MKPPNKLPSGIKAPFDIDTVVERIELTVRSLPKAALFELAEDGYRSAFEQLIACIISIRTYDEVMLPTARRLFAVARTPAEISRLSVAEIDKLIHESSFHERKAAQIAAIARRVVTEFDGVLPCQLDIMLSFHGVGPKCAHLVLGIACDQPRIGVDVHVHRVTNRWGYIATSSPERSTEVLEAQLPHRYWVEINRLLVPFGKHICTGKLPRCSICPVLDMCRQVGVAAHR
jgi:endonuclease-3